MCIGASLLMSIFAKDADFEIICTDASLIQVVELQMFTPFWITDM